MKRFILSLVFVLVAMFGFAQAPHMNFLDRPNFKKYEVVDSLPIERVLVHFNKEYDDDVLIPLGDGDYMAPVPHKDNMIIRTTTDKTKAIVIYNSYVFGRHLEFNMEENERRITLWYKNGNTYCGYIYDKQYKICKYFESKKEFNNFMRYRFFRRNIQH